MKKITLENFRCFHEKQVAHLAPLTLLVGDNSTGKTSFLAMIRALWDCIYSHQIPNFKEDPFDLGSFEEIAYRHNGRTPQVSTFGGTLLLDNNLEATFEFGKKKTMAVPVRTSLRSNGAWIEEFKDREGNTRVQIKTHRGRWEAPLTSIDVHDSSTSLFFARRLTLATIPEISFPESVGKITTLSPVQGSPEFTKEDANVIVSSGLLNFDRKENRPFVSAPARSKPQRTYDPEGLISDPEGSTIPMLMADLAYTGGKEWINFKNKLEHFGSTAGIFDEISIKRLGKSRSAPFQIQIRKFGKRRKGPKQNLIDVGYGISQVLPILTELLLPENHRMVLLQQPDIHLHPSVQAALGTLFCEIAGLGRQLIVEAHSNYVIDRIRMDVRDKKTNLKPDDVSILYFERNDTSVQIHNIKIDELGNVLNTPNSYGRFFMEEMDRSIWF
ncbi:MAG: AAA family ATPase [Bacteroidetes bacterium]|nr:AAA family ATPase [Bacteroidota bacterium]